MLTSIRTPGRLGSIALAMCLMVTPSVAVAAEPDASASPTAASPSMALFAGLPPEAITVSYTCDGLTTFTATDLVEGPSPASIRPPLPANPSLDTDVLIDTGAWRVVSHDDARATVIAPSGYAGRAGEQWPLYYVTFTTDGNGWVWREEGDCGPLALFEDPRAFGGYLQDGLAGRLNGESETSLALELSHAEDCPAGAESLGSPAVSLIEDAVLIAAPVATLAEGEFCGEDEPTVVTIELGEPRDGRALYDMGRLPVRPLD